MSTRKSSVDHQIDLLAIKNEIGNFFQHLSTSIFNGIQFFIRNIIVIGILFALGIGLGIYLDKNQKTYNHEIIVTPNFGSTDYLYSKIDLLQSKIKEHDTLFLKAIGIQKPGFLTKIEIQPIIDVYKFISNSDQNFQLLKLMAEDGDLKKIIEEKATSKNYTYHRITFVTKDLSSYKQTLEPLMNYFNNSVFFGKIQKEYVNNQQIKIRADEATIAQIDGFLNTFSNTVNGNSKSDKLVYYNENTQLNDVIKTKDKFVDELGQIRINLVGYDKIIKENSSTSNIENTESVNGKLKFVLPFLFIGLYIAMLYFVSFYKKQSLRYK